MPDNRMIGTLSDIEARPSRNNISCRSEIGGVAFGLRRFSRRFLFFFFERGAFSLRARKGGGGESARSKSAVCDRPPPFPPFGDGGAVLDRLPAWALRRAFACSA